MTRTLLLFDIDGTLLTTGGTGMRAMRSVAARLFGPRFNWDGIETGGSLDPIIFAEAARRNGISDIETHHLAFRDQYIAQLQRDLPAAAGRIQAMPGVHELLDLLRRRRRQQGDIVLGLLTGNYRRVVPLKLQAIGFKTGWFTVEAFGDEAPTRPDLVRLAIDRYQQQTGHEPERRRVVVIGDTPRDVACAAAHGCVSFAVATGQFTHRQLAAAGADHVVEDLTDPGPLVALLDDLVQCQPNA